MIKNAIENSHSIWAVDPGLGKTAAALASFSFLKKRGIVSKMLVVCPLKVAYLVWPAEMEKWTDFENLRYVVLHGPTRDESHIKDADVCIINFDGLDWLLSTKKRPNPNPNLRGRTAASVDVGKFRKYGFDMLVIDELTAFKNAMSGRSKMLRVVRNTFNRVYGLTGSLVANGLMDLFGQCLIVDGGRTFGQYITRFRAEYFVPGYDGFSWVLQANAEERIYKKLKPLALRLEAADFIDLPMLVDVDRKFPLPDKIRKIYDSLEDDLIAELESRTFVAANAAAASIKCRQVVSGALYHDPEIVDLLGPKMVRGKREWTELHTEKMALLHNLIEELQGAPLLVAYDFRHTLERLQAELGASIPYIGGGTPAGELKKIEKDWNAGKIPILLGHPQSIGHGLNLQGGDACHVVWFDLTWNYELYDQLIRRLRRQGSRAKRIFVYHLIGDKTIDEAMIWSLRAKAKGQAALYDALKNMRSRRK